MRDRLRRLPLPARWTVWVLLCVALLWPQFVLTAANGFMLGITFLSGGFLGLIFKRWEDRETKARTGWDGHEARERVALARRGELPDGERERARLRYLLDRQRSDAKAGPWIIGLGAPLLAAWVVGVSLSKHMPALALAGGIWYAALGAAVFPSTLRSSRKDRTEVRQALHLLGDTGHRGR